eukprot:TRINITY_DN50113_c0_g1_i1.p1 TRINITY_DN50113_c0_g1~~TRINITY_DN50113_c0_g1_i1.p1  ORF type:complete len:174 (+),score=25.22 TRINITY_DN50113_c0_g1_i1:114-635(+)
MENEARAQKEAFRAAFKLSGGASRRNGFLRSLAAHACPVCLELAPDIVVVCCGTAFHFACLSRWLAAGRGAGRLTCCPQCRAGLEAETAGGDGNDDHANALAELSSSRHRVSSQLHQQQPRLLQPAVRIPDGVGAANSAPPSEAREHLARLLGAARGGLQRRALPVDRSPAVR